MDIISVEHFYEEGKRGELVMLVALDRQIIPNTKFEHHKIIPEKVDSILHEKSVIYNCINGDFNYVDSITMVHEFVDVKIGNWISETSLKRFRNDGWFLLNAIYESQPVFLRQSEELKRILEKIYRKTSAKTGDLGFRIMKSDLISAGLNEYNFKEFDAESFQRIRSEVNTLKL